ncbi:hypothetical protein ACET3Z_029361 [Daucus carota]
MATIVRKQLSTNIVSKYRTVVVEFKYHKVQVVTLAIAGSLSIKNEEVQVSVTLATIVPNQGLAGSSKHLRNSWKALNQEPTGVFGTALYGFGNAGNMGDRHQLY